MKKALLITKRKGYALLEIILAISVFALVMTAFTGIFYYGEESASISGKRSRATLIAQEGLEAVRSIRDGIYQGTEIIEGANGFDNLKNGTYGLSNPGAGGTWMFSGTSDTTDIFTRQIDISDCDDQRPNCKKIKSIVTWKQNNQRDGEVALETILSNWVEFRVQCGNGTLEGTEECDDGNQTDGDGCSSSCRKPETCNEVCVSQFGCNGGFGCSGGYCRNLLCSTEPSCICPSCGDGECNDGETCATCPGDCTSGCGGASTIGNWGNPSLVASINLSPWYTYYDKWKVQILGDFAYIVRTVWYPHFVAINIADPLNPIVAGQRTLSGTQVNLYAFGNYAYVASSFITKEMQIIDISQPASLPVVSNYNAPGIMPSLGVYMKDAYAYLVRAFDFFGNEFNIINVSNPAAPATVGSLKLNTSAYDVISLENYAYIATSSDTKELQVVNISAPSSPVLASTLNLPLSEDAISIAGSGSLILVGTKGSSDTAGKLYIIDVANPSSPQILSSFDAQGMVQDMDIGNEGKYVFIVTSNTERALQIIDISTPSSPSLVGLYVHTGKLHGVDYNDEQDRVYAVGESRNNEFLVFAPE